jgi:REP-associated tyrosine transposase
MALMRNKDWQIEYREARANWLTGLPAMFPHGTYWLRRFASVHVKAPPEAN